jgi:hypothetical protein
MKFFLIITCLLFSSVMKAQTDSTRSDSTNYTLKQKDNELVKQPQPNLIQVEASQLPPPLLKTLSNSKYEGWKNSIVYKDKATNEYMFVIGNGEKATTYRFNAKGELIKKEKDN